MDQKLIKEAKKLGIPLQIETGRWVASNEIMFSDLVDAVKKILKDNKEEDCMLKINPYYDSLDCDGPDENGAEIVVCIMTDKTDKILEINIKKEKDRKQLELKRLERRIEELNGELL